MDNKIFKKDHKRYKFDYLIETDGVGASIIFVHKSYKRVGNNPKVKKEDTVFLDYVDDLKDEKLDAIKQKKIVGVN